MLKKLINTFKDNGTQFVGFTYTNKQGETSKYIIQTNTSYENALKKDLILLSTLEYKETDKFDKETFETAKEEIVKSIKMSLGLNETITSAEIIELLKMSLGKLDETMTKEEIVKSIKMSLEKLDGAITKTEIEQHQNRSNGQKDAYINITPNIKYNIENMEVHIFAKKHQKTVLVEGVYPIVKSRAKTIAKNLIRNCMKSTQYRTFIITNVETIKVNGDIIEFV
jgi:hypothetical protein